MLQRLWSSSKSRADGEEAAGGAPLAGGAVVAAAAATQQQRDPTEQMRELQRLVEKLKGYHDLARVSEDPVAAADPPMGAHCSCCGSALPLASFLACKLPDLS